MKAKCPWCEKMHTMPIDWTGNGTPRKFCLACQWIKNPRTDTSRKYQTKQPTTLLGLSRTRGMARDEKKAYDIKLELLGRQWRKNLPQKMIAAS